MPFLKRLAARHVAAGAVLAAIAVGASSCVGLFDLESFSGATSGLCARLSECFGEDYFPECQAHADGQLGLAAPDARAAWLTHFADSHCLENCVNARACLDALPLCGPTDASCAQAEQCCGFTGTAGCKSGTCCAGKGEPCTSTAQCCDEECKDGVCGQCKDAGADCANDFECCSDVCDPVRHVCNPTGCLPDGAECAGGYQCCNDYCDPVLLTCGGGECLPDGFPCDDAGACCNDYCTRQPYDDVNVCAPGKCIVDGFTCADDFECCGQFCDPTYWKCGAAEPCKSEGSECMDGSECCSGYCPKEAEAELGFCACAPEGYPCSDHFRCCNLECTDGGTCAVTSCTPAGDVCNTPEQCCSGRCSPESSCCQFADCSHDVCQVGGPLDESCGSACVDCGDVTAGSCVTDVCKTAGYEHCCCSEWDESCKEAAQQICGVLCAQIGMGEPGMPANPD